MKIVSSINETQSIGLELRKGNIFHGFVPTMGALHEGHLSLVRLARTQTDRVTVSIFVNPTQFGPHEDLSSYPRDFEQDQHLLQEEGVDYVFYPTPEIMYPEGYETYVAVKQLKVPLCGKSRPDHFDGVCTVVTKLFNIVQPTHAYFGLKDYQQYRIIKTMTRDLNIPIEIIGGSIIRESDGLALSSRNAYLSAEERRVSLKLNQALFLAQDHILRGETNPQTIRLMMQQELSHPLITIDYLALTDPETLLEQNPITPPTLIAGAIYVGKTRLIDNTLIHPTT